MALILDKRSLAAVLFKINNESLDLCEHEIKNCDLNNCFCSFFTKMTLNEDCERLCSCSSARIKIIFTMCFIMSDNRSIINLSSRLIVVFDFFYDERDNFKFKKKLSLKLKSKSF